MHKELEANFSTLILSIASAAAMHLGENSGSSQKVEKNPSLAKFNIELLRLLQEKTKGNLSPEEDSLLLRVLKDLQLKYVTETKKQ
ncbi:MAG: DUF1844 domain-containing protein [Bdellovibrionales bacterium]|nr:DUF1844 domain-containing protein [Bdellovibrionales bacterium]